ncbi:MAG: sugar MFS transporter [Helicobacteraceae bacterium]|nr:sugar MFS transporter [Helicobacteraceae bacterium]
MQTKPSSLVPMMIIGILFFIFGFVTWLNGSLIPFLKLICDLNDVQALFVTFAFYIAYTTMAYPMSFILTKTGYKKGMAIGLGIMAAGALLFIPAAFSANFLLFLVALFTLGSGLTILQTASNPYIVLIGPTESAAMRSSIMGVINKGAGIIAPLVFTALIFSDLSSFSKEVLTSGEIEILASKLIMPYIVMALILIGLIFLVLFSSLPEIEFSDAEQNEERTSIFHYPQIVLGAVALFLYVGVEVVAGDTIGLFGQRLGVDNYTALTSYTMVFMVLGYLIGVFGIPKYLSQQNALTFSAIGGFATITALLFSSDQSSAISTVLWGWSGIATIPDPVALVAILGLSHALVWPSIWPLALNGLGKLTAQGSALLIMSIAGGAILPLIFGQMADLGGNMQFAYAITIPCYLFIFYYAIKGHKIRRWNR